MTREEMVQSLDGTLMDIEPHEGCTMAEFRRQCDGLQAIRAELLKTCATCKNMQPCSRYECPLPLCIETDSHVPADGSGFCHRWEGKP